MMNGMRNSNNEKAKIAESYNRLYAQFSSDEIKEVGNYSILKLIGEGSFGKVYLANHKLTHTKVVLKTGNKTDPNLVREVYYHRQFKHPHIARLYEVVVSEGKIWMVLEYCPGRELYDYVISCGRIPIDEARTLFAQITSAVFYAHSLSCIHRDLKLENILLDKRRNAKLSDFGFTRECEQRNFLETICGTTVYMAPELIQKQKYDGFKVDIWSLGIILYTMFYGEMPFDEEDEIKTSYKIVNHEPIYKDDIPPEAISLIKKLLDKKPSQRPTCLEILNDPFLENVGLNLMDTSMTLLKSIANQNNFHTKSEKHLLKKLKSLGIDTHALQKSVITKKADSLCGLWELLLEKEKKKEVKKYKTRSRSVLRFSESTSRRVSQLMDPANSPQLSRIVSGFSNRSEPIQHSHEKEPQRDNTSMYKSTSGSIASPEKKKNGFMQKFTKLWKGKKNDHTNTINNQRESFDNMHRDNKHFNSHNNSIQQHSQLQPPVQINNSKISIPKPSFKTSPNKLTIHEPRSPSKLSNGPGQQQHPQQQQQHQNHQQKARPRPISMISQQSLASQVTTMSDLSIASHNTTYSDSRPTFTRKRSSDTSLHSKNTTRRSLSLISSNSSTSDRSSRKGSFYDQSTSSADFSFRTNRGRKYNEAIFPRTFKRRKSPLGGILPSSKFKRSKAFIIEEEEDDDEDDGEGDDDENMDDIETDMENLGIAESTRVASDFESDVSERGRQL